MSDNTAIAKDAVDVVSGAVVIGALADILPAIAAGLSIVWLLIRIGEWCVAKKRAWGSRK